MDNITAQFPIGKLRAAFVGNVLIFTAVGYIDVMLVVLFLQFHFFGALYEFPKSIKILIFAVTPVPGLLFGLWFARKEINKGCWELTDTELLRGIYNQQKFPLASIEKIIVGLPMTNAVGKVLQQAKPGTALGVSVDVLSTIQPVIKTVKVLAVLSTVKENSLLICFKDGSWLPLRFFALPNGRALMDALRERCKDRVVESYNFSPNELRRLCRRDANGLIPPPKN